MTDKPRKKIIVYSSRGDVTTHNATGVQVLEHNGNVLVVSDGPLDIALYRDWTRVTIEPLVQPT